MQYPQPMPYGASVPQAPHFLPPPPPGVQPGVHHVPMVSPRRQTDLGPEGQFYDVNGTYVRVKRKLCWFYKRFNPTKIELVDRILRERGGVVAGDEIFEELCSRYSRGSEYLAVYDALEAFYCAFNPEKADLVGPIMEEWVDREDKLMRTLEKKYGTPFFRDRGLLLPRPDPHPVEALVERFIRDVYTRYCPQMLPFVPTLTVIYKDRFSELASAVALKFNVPVPEELVRMLGPDAFSDRVTAGAPQLQDGMSHAHPSTQVQSTVETEPAEVQKIIDEKDSLIKAQMNLIEDYAMQLDHRKQEANSHEQTVSYLRQLHARANSVIDKFGRHLRHMSQTYEQSNGAQMPLGELSNLCQILGIDESAVLDQAPQEAQGAAATAAPQQAAPHQHHPAPPPPPPPQQHQQQQHQQQQYQHLFPHHHLQQPESSGVSQQAAQGGTQAQTIPSLYPQRMEGHVSMPHAVQAAGGAGVGGFAGYHHSYNVPGAAAISDAPDPLDETMVPNIHPSLYHVLDTPFAEEESLPPSPQQKARAERSPSI